MILVKLNIFIMSKMIRLYFEYCVHLITRNLLQATHRINVGEH